MRLPRHYFLLGSALVLSALASPGLRAELLLWETFQHNGQSNGWSGGWNDVNGLKVDKSANALRGKGMAERSILRTIDFDRDGEYFLSARILRRGAGPSAESDYATVSLTATKSAANERLAHFGISSREAFDVGLTSEEHQYFGDAPGEQAYTIVVRIRTSSDEPDILDAWAWPATDATPPEPPDHPMATSEKDVSGSGSVLRMQTGSRAELDAEFQEIRVGTTWADVVYDTPSVAAEPSDYRKFQTLQVTADGVHALPIQWAGVSVLPTGPGKPPEIVVNSKHEWLANPVVIFNPANPAMTAMAKPAPNPRLPLYGPATPTTLLDRGNHQAVPRADGGFDVYHIQRLERMAEIDAMGSFKPLSPPETILLGDPIDTRPRVEILENLRQGPGVEMFIGDVDGDGIPDLLIGKMAAPEEQWTYWPERDSPWVLERRPNVGPNHDLETSEGFRGYGVDGQWLGSRRTMKLTWAQGSRDGERLRFGAERPVYYGRDDFEVQWRSFSRELSPAIIERAGQRHVVLFGGVDQALALPVLATDDGELHLGRSQPLLADGESVADLILPSVIAVLDVTGDGRTEILVGSGANGRLVVMGGDEVGNFETLGTLQTQGGPLAADTLTVPARGDWDGDGLPDLITGDGTGYYLLWPGTQDPLVYEGSRTFSDADGQPIIFKGAPNLQGPYEQGWSYSQPGLIDWDGNGHLDLIGNDNTSTLRLYTRLSDEESWKVEDKIFTKDGHKLGVAWRSRVSALPGSLGLAGDNRPVLLLIGLDQNLALGVPKTTGSTEIERLIPLKFTDGHPIQTAGFAGMSGRTQLSGADWDGDGKWDLILNVPAKNVPVVYDDPNDLALNDYYRTCAAFWYRNVGTNADPSFEKPRRLRWANGDVIRVETHAFNVEPTDLDGDGQLDILVGDGPGFVHYFLRKDLSWDH